MILAHALICFSKDTHWTVCAALKQQMFKVLILNFQIHYGYLIQEI